MSLDLESVRRATAGSREGLLASGFELDCSDGPGGALRFTIRALPDACDECLVPKPVFTAILQQELKDAGLTVGGIELVYPVEVER